MKSQFPPITIYFCYLKLVLSHFHINCDLDLVLWYQHSNFNQDHDLGSGRYLFLLRCGYPNNKYDTNLCYKSWSHICSWLDFRQYGQSQFLETSSQIIIQNYPSMVRYTIPFSRANLSCSFLPCTATRSSSKV